MKKFNRKAVITLAVAAVVTTATVVGSTLAYFTDTESAENVVTMGNVNITLADELDGKTIEKIVPNQTISDAVTVKNDGVNDAFVRLKVSFDGLTAEEIESTFVSNGAKHKTENFVSKDDADARVAELKENGIEATVESGKVETDVIDLYENTGSNRMVNYWLTTSETMAFIPIVKENADGTVSYEFHKMIPNLYNKGTIPFSYLGVDWTFNYASGGQTAIKTVTINPENQKLIVVDLSTGKEISVEDYTKFVNRNGFSYKYDSKTEEYGYKWSVVTTKEVDGYVVSYDEPETYAGINSSFTKADAANKDGSIYYYYNGVLKAGSDAVSILDTVKIPASWGNYYADKKFSFTITAEAIQSDLVEISDGVYATTSKEAFDYVDGNSIAIEKYNK